MDTVENTRMDVCQPDIKFIHPNYYGFDTRLTSYQQWPKQIIPDKFSLAKSGFFYTGQSDIVKCFSCGVQVCDWKNTDDSFQEHYKNSPECVFLAMIGYHAPVPPLFQSNTDNNSISSLSVNTSDCDWRSFSSPLPWRSIFKNQSWTNDEQFP